MTASGSSAGSAVSEASPFSIRDLSGSEEFTACVRLQEETWGAGFSERVPSAILRVAARLGGVVAGAFEPEGRMVGFVFGLTGWEDGRPIHWSDMLAVREEFRGRGLGRALKLHQRERLLSLGVTRMHWTFDPLEARNGHLNLNRLGAVVREYVEDMYGPSDSPLHRGIGTDRFVALWELDSPRVEERLSSSLPEFSGEFREVLGVTGGRDGGGPSGPGDLPGSGDPSTPADLPIPGEPLLHRGDSVVGVAIPLRIQEVKARNPELAARWRQATREALTHYMERGWELRALRRHPDRSLAHHLLFRSEDG